MSRNVVAFISLGSNMGDSENILRRAIERLETLSIAPVQKSSLWQTTPVDCPPGSPQFVNAVAGITPVAAETPESLLEKLQQLEKDFGRKSKAVLNEPRRLDLDLICFGNEKRLSGWLTLPHPRATTRRFVLAPLAELAPDLILLGQHQSVAELLAQLDSPERVFRLSA
jgi:2-amino-4-hydroxy-6-hydroxymethyldihydropteridine diphosphokinase